jgi:hypothetical protein
MHQVPELSVFCWIVEGVAIYEPSGRKIRIQLHDLFGGRFGFI